MLPWPKISRSFACFAAFFLICGLAHGAVIYTDVMTITAGDPTQLGRLSRSGVPSDWSVAATCSRVCLCPLCPEIEQPRCDREVGRVHAVARRSRACTVGQVRGNGRGACAQAVPYGTSDLSRGSVQVSVLASKTSKPQRQKPQ